MQLKNNLTVLSRVSKIAYNFTLVAVNPNNNQIQFDFLAFWLDNKSIEDVPAATIQFVLHFLQQSTASLRKDRVVKMKSVLLSVLFIALLLVLTLMTELNYSADNRFNSYFNLLIDIHNY